MTLVRELVTNAATTSPVTEPFSVFAPAKEPQFIRLVFDPFDPSLGTLTGVDFSMSSTLAGSPSIAFVDIGPATIAGAGGPRTFDFSDISGLQGSLTTADYTRGPVIVSLSLSPELGSAAWTGNGSGQGLTLVYDYIPAVAATTPLPATLPLFATGLGALGLLGWRRKRKPLAVA